MLMVSIYSPFVSALCVIHSTLIHCYITIHTEMDCGVMDVIIATMSEKCLVMVMLVFDVPYQHGALYVKMQLFWGLRWLDYT